MTQRIDLMPQSCRAKLGRRRQIQFWVAMYGCAAALLVIGHTFFELSKAEVRRESAQIAGKVALDDEQRVRAKALRAEIERIERALDRNMRIAWPIDISDVIASIGALAPDSVYLTKIALVPRQERGRTTRRAGDDDGPEPLPRTRLQIECAGVAPDDHAMARFVAGLEDHPLFERLAVEHVRPSTMNDRQVKEFGFTCEIDFYNRFRIQSPVASAPNEEQSAAAQEGAR